MATIAVNSTNENRILEAIIIDLLPDVCQEHVYRFDHSRSITAVDNGEYVYAAWTFYNDERVRMKLRVHRDDPYSHMRLRLEPVDFDLIEWQADAIMRCEAGEDIWDRPPKQTDWVHRAAAAQSQLQSAQVGSMQNQSGMANSPQSNGFGYGLSMNPIFGRK